MIYEKKKLMVRRIIWAVVLLLGIIIPVIMSGVSHNNVEIIDDNGYINEYYESLNETSCEIEVAFNREVDSGYITVAFYDINGQLLSKKRGFFYGYDTTLSSTFYVYGEVDSYEILEYDVELSDDVSIGVVIAFVWIDIFAFAFFVGSLLLSCKIYEYCGNEIIVYAGWYHHYIKVNGVKLDEHNTLISFTAIHLSCTLNDGTDMNATITLTNRISLKINNQLHANRK